jgi:hypothetical protein
MIIFESFILTLIALRHVYCAKGTSKIPLGNKIFYYRHLGPNLKGRIRNLGGASIKFPSHLYKPNKSLKI